jgi:hypothetical protein
VTIVEELDAGIELDEVVDEDEVDVNEEDEATSEEATKEELLEVETTSEDIIELKTLETVELSKEEFDENEEEGCAQAVNKISINDKGKV